MNKLAELKKASPNSVYRNLYPWKSFDQFFDSIRQTIAYKSGDNSIIAICKPFGVGTYTREDKNVAKQNQDRLLYQLQGQPKYCLKDVLDPLTQELGSPQPYCVIKSIDRYLSGLVLLTNDYKKWRPRFEESLTVSKIHKQPSFGLRAISSGFPTIKNNKIYEKVAVELVEVDEFGDYLEPIIITQPTRKHLKTRDTYQAELEVKGVNRDYSVALLELFVSRLKNDFPRLYISSKTSFVLGDVRFSKRIRQILGKQIQVSAFKSSHRYDDAYEPIDVKLRKALGVRKNSQIPLMLDHNCLRLKQFFPKGGDRDLIIQSNFVPEHFAATASSLGLGD